MGRTERSGIFFFLAVIIVAGFFVSFRYGGDPQTSESVRFAVIAIPISAGAILGLMLKKSK